MFIFGLCSTSDDWLSNPGKKCWLKCKKTKKAPKSLKNKMFVFLIMFNFWWLAEQSGQKMLTETQKNEKGPLSHWKIKCSFLDYVQLLIIGQAIWAKNVDRKAKNEKGPLGHWKIKCSFLDYVQLLMIGQAIRAKNVDRKAKKLKRPPRSSKNIMLVFGLCSTSDDQLSNPGKKCWLKCKKTKKAP